MSDKQTPMLQELLLRWQAFSELQQRAFAFLAAEAIQAGQEFEQSTDGATNVLIRLGNSEPDDKPQMMGEIFQVVQHLQSADRSRQGLEQVASVLTTLQQEHAALVAASQSLSPIPPAEAMQEKWIESMAQNICLADWRRRLIQALNGQEPTLPHTGNDDDQDELF